MHPVVRKALLKSILLNLLAGIGGMIPFLFLKGDAELNWAILLIGLTGVSLFFQVITGIVYQFDSRKEAGKGMLLGAGVLLLIGFSVCSMIEYYCLF